jgi:hypothetical protein
MISSEERREDFAAPERLDSSSAISATDFRSALFTLTPKRSRPSISP